jgi:Peptidase_C39 like family
MNCSQAQVAISNALFLGVETFSWTLAPFDQAAQFAAAHSLDTLIVKVFDGANGNVGSPDEWYGPIGGFAAVKKTIEAHGLKVLPYGYLYGNSKGSILADELALVEKYMNTYGWFMADIEMEWDGHVDWAVTLNRVLSSNPNLLYISILADPVEQNMSAVLQAMAPSVNAWVPQVYDQFLESVYIGEMAGLACVLPAVDLSNEFGTNNPLQYAAAVGAPVCVWEYQYAVANPGLLDSIIQTVKEQPMVQLSSTGEIADFCDADQFQPAKTQDACGFFAVSIVDGAAPVGQPCRKTAAKIISDAETWYAQYNGDNSISNQMGMSVPQEQQLLSQVGLHWFQIETSVSVIRAWVKAGYPVIIAGAEAGMYDMGLGDVVPYYWNYQSFNHIITITGVTSDGNFLVRDSANVTDLNNPTSLRPGPRKYDASKLELISAHAVVMHGQAVPNVIGGVPVGVPAGWKDDGKTLTAPNGVPVVMGFRNEVLNSNWDAGNVPMAAEYATNNVLLHNSSVGAGTVQLFVKSLLWWTQRKGVVNEPQLGAEIAAAYALIASLKSQIATLQQQLAAAQPGQSISPAMQQAINQAEATLTQAAQALQPFVK